MIRGHRRLVITASLHRALQSFRGTYSQMPRAYAICIDQPSIPERNQRVSITGTNYKQAQGVYV